MSRARRAIRRTARTGLILCGCAAASEARAQAASPGEIALDAIHVEGSGRASGVAPGGLTRTRTNLGILGNRRVIETPFSITGYTEKLIRDQEAQTLSDTLKNDPSVTNPRTRGTFFDIPYIRGFPIGNSNLLLNGLPSLLGNGQNIPVEPFERFDVLKGPAAFFYGTSGFAGVGGAVDLVMKRAPLEAVNAAVIGYAGTSLVRGSIDVARRWGDEGEFGLRINTAVERGESNVDDLRIERALGSLAFDWRANERLRVYLDAIVSQYDIRGYQNSLAISPIGQLPFIPKAPKLSNSVTQPWAFYPTTLAVGIARVEYDLAEDWTLSGAYGVGYAYRPTLPSPGAPTLLNTAGDIRIAASYGDYTAFDPNQSATVSLRGKARTGPLKHDLVLGGDFQSSTTISVPVTFLPAVISNIYLPRIYARPTLPPNGQRNRLFDSVSYGVGFTDIISTEDDRFFVLGGGRYSHVEYSNFNVANGAVVNTFAGGRFNPIVAAGFRPTPDSLVYANYAEAFERGGIAPVGTVNANTALPPLTSNSVEVGAKAEFEGIIATLALFQINKGLEYTNPNTNRYVQDGRQIHQGLEVLLSGEITPSLRIIGGIQALNPFVRNTANPANDGNDPIGVPRLQTSLFVEYDLPFVDGLSVNGGVYHYSRQFVDIENARTIPDWTRLDLGARYAFALPNGTRATARLVVENVFDTNYWSSVALGSLSLGTPRTFKASMTLVW
ncbi:TonB-dependent receptor [Methylobacterium oryzisoli]|uniref:TonB-dependent receptor n=1 Tax=Methylobacterium oryzisoli TaxID=3385502 RepID=UPI0038912B49